MAQKKVKATVKRPPIVKQKTKREKGPAVSKRANCPIKSKKVRSTEANKFRRTITKTVNKAVEDEIRSRALPTPKLSKIQKEIAKLNQDDPGQYKKTKNIGIRLTKSTNFRFKN